MTDRAKNLKGKRFGKLKVLQRANSIRSNSGKSYARWKCMCDCGEQCVIRSANLSKGTTNSCGCNAGNRLPEGDSEVNYLIYQYKRDASYVNRGFYLSRKVFKKLIRNNCYYCNSKPNSCFNKHKKKRFLYNGIDRVNSNRGYYKDNCVSCCYKCNFAKHKMTEQDFKEHIIKIYNHWANK